jgi:hypothetical protein
MFGPVAIPIWAALHSFSRHAPTISFSVAFQIRLRTRDQEFDYPFLTTAEELGFWLPNELYRSLEHFRHEKQRELKTKFLFSFI